MASECLPHQSECLPHQSERLPHQSDCLPHQEHSRWVDISYALAYKVAVAALRTMEGQRRDPKYWRASLALLLPIEGNPHSNPKPPTPNPQTPHPKPKLQPQLQS